MGKATQTETTTTKKKTVKITPKKTGTGKSQKRCPTCGAYRK